MTSSTQRVVIVTGGSRGIGREVAGRLAAHGYAVVLNYAGNKAGADAAVETITSDGGTAIAVQADVADEAAVSALFGTAEREFGGIDLVVHAAGGMPVDPLVDLDVLDRVLLTNLRGTFVVDQQAARRLRPGGAIINFSSSIGRFSRPGYSAYAASKDGVEAISRMILARELRGRDITVNVVAPGPTGTELFLQGKDEALLEAIATPGDIAEVVAFLAGAAHWINGQVLYVNGGAV